MTRDREPLSPLEQRMLDGLLQVAEADTVHSGPPRRSRFAWLAVAAATVLGLLAATTVATLRAPSTPDTPVQRAPAPGHIGYRKLITGTQYVSTRLLDGRYVDITAEIRGGAELWAELSDPRVIRAKLDPHQVISCQPADRPDLCGNWLGSNTGQGLGLRLNPEDRTVAGQGRHPESEATGLSPQLLNLLPTDLVSGQPVSSLPEDPAALAARFDELVRQAHQSRSKMPSTEPSPGDRLRLAVDTLLAVGATPAQRAAAWTVAKGAAGTGENPATDRLGRPGVAVEFGSSWGSRSQLIVDPATHTLLSRSETYPRPKDTERQPIPVAAADYTLYLSGGAVRSTAEVR